MASVLAVLCTSRTQGRTATVLRAMGRGVERVPGVTVEEVRLTRYQFGPCLSTFWCARHHGIGCGLPDDMGRKGAGPLFQKVWNTNGMILATPVHTWGPSALSHVFFERLYPFLWNNRLNGLPFIPLACATNQGMHRQAIVEMTKWAFCRGMRYLGGLAVHAVDFDQALIQAEQMGERLGQAALQDATDGRKLFTDEERFAFYMQMPWTPLDPYLDNVTDGTFQTDGSLLTRAEAVFRVPEARALLQEAKRAFEASLQARQQGRLEQANQALVRASAYWTNATWKEYVEEYISRAEPLTAYRTLPSAFTDESSGYRPMPSQGYADDAEGDTDEV